MIQLPRSQVRKADAMSSYKMGHSRQLGRAISCYEDMNHIYILYASTGLNQSAKT